MSPVSESNHQNVSSASNNDNMKDKRTQHFPVPVNKKMQSVQKKCLKTFGLLGNPPPLPPLRTKLKKPHFFSKLPNARALV